MISIEESKQRIKTTLEWWPGIKLPTMRQAGKTTAILEMVHEKHHGDAAYFTFNKDVAEHARKKYADMFPRDKPLYVGSQLIDLRGCLLPVYIDEWWHISPDIREQLNMVRVVCRIGTPNIYD